MFDMKLAYIAILNQPSIGVEEHVFLRAKAAIEIGDVNFDFYIIRQIEDSVSRQEKLPNFFYLEPLPTNKIVKQFHSIFYRYAEILNSNLFSKYDKIILRYSGSDISARKLAKKFQIISEHHSDILSELIIKKNSDISLSEKFLKNLRLLLEYKYGKDFLSNCDGIIGVTDEVRKGEVIRSGRNIPSCVISNGIDVDNIAHTGYKPFNGKHLDMVLVAAVISSNRTPWHGLDRVVEGMKRYKGNVVLNLHLIGSCQEKLPDTIGDHKIIIHGNKNHQEYDEIMKTMNLGISTLGLHRKNMAQACSLKTREYVARGLPFIFSYEDPDLQETETQFFHKVSADDKPLDFETILDYLTSISKSSGSSISLSMREYAEEKMDWKTKVELMHKFAAEN